MKLPPLNSVRAFEAAARHASFRLAAEELYVTPGAVSQQVKTLEDYLGTRLFERLPRAVRLTAAGQDFFSACTRHLRGIAQAAERARPRDDQVALTVVPTFATRWLMPRLATFTRRDPGVQVRIEATPALADFSSDNFDLGIRLGTGAYTDLDHCQLFPEIVVPICTPQYRDSLLFTGASGKPRVNFAEARLLHENAPDGFWPQWLAAQKLDKIDASAGMHFSHGMLVLAAALGGQGVALQPREFVAQELGSGRLVLADERPFATGRGYYLVWPKSASGPAPTRPLRPAVTRFRDWLLEEVEQACKPGPAAKPGGALPTLPTP